MNLSERLEALMAAAEPTDNAERDHNAPDAECVFVDMRPAKFDALLREAADLARRVEGAPTVQITECNQIEGAKDFDYGDMVAASQKFDAGQRVRIVPEQGEGEG